MQRRTGNVLSMVLFHLLVVGLAAGFGRSGEPPQTLTPESLAMARTSMAFTNDRTVRLFNGRGAISVRDKSVMGLQELLFPAIAARDYRFQLAFREKQTNVLIQDVVADVYEHLVLTGKGPHPLGLTFQTPGAPFVMILQEAHWQPATYLRTGTFHKKFGEHWVSFGIETKTLVSAATDEIYLEVRIENRQPAPLVFTVVPEQSAPELGAPIPGEKPGAPGPVMHPDVFTVASSQVRVTVVSDLAQHANAGWRWEIPARATATARLAIVPQSAKTPAPDAHSPDIALRMERADRALRDRLRWAEEKLPRVTTANQDFDDLYRRSILSVLESGWERENFVVRPFYAVGTWTFTIPWDTLSCPAVSIEWEVTVPSRGSL